MTNLREQIRLHQEATATSDSTMLRILCDYLTRLDDRGHVPHDDHVIDFVQENLERGPMDIPIDFWRSAIFTDEEKNQMVIMMEEEIRDSLKHFAQDTLDGEDEVSIIGYAADDCEALAEMLQRIDNKGDEEYITGEFLREHDDGDGYPAMLDFATRTGLLGEDEETVTDRGREFISRFA